MSIEEPRALVEISINLFDLRHFKALGCGTKSGCLLSSDLCLSGRRNFMSNIIDLRLQGLFGKILVVLSLITVVLFPSLGFRCSLNLSLLLSPGGSGFTSCKILLGPVKDSHFMVIRGRLFTFIGDPRIKRCHVIGVVHILSKVTLSLGIITVRENIGHLQFKL